MITVPKATGDPIVDTRTHGKHLFSLSWPNIMINFIQSVVWLSSTFFVSHLGPKYLAAAALGSMIFNASGLSFGIGLSMGLDTLCTQAFGAQQYKLVGLHLQRAMVLLTLACIPIITLWLFTAKILIFAGVDEEIAQHAQIWIHWLMPGLWPELIFEALKRFLVAQQIVLPQTIATFIVSPLHVLYSWGLVKYFGYEGAALASSISNWSWLVVTLIVYLIYRHIKVKQFDEKEGILFRSEEENISEYNSDNPYSVCPPLSKAILRGWKDYLLLGIPGAFSLMMEWGSWEVNALIVARLPNATVELATHSVLCNTVGFWYSPIVGIGTALTTCIGNSLGAQQSASAQIYFRIATIQVLMFSILNGMAAYFYRWQWGHLWSDNEEVIANIASCMFLLWGYGIVDVTKCIGSAVLRACGRPAVSLGIFVFSTIVVGYPASIALGFYLKIGLSGIWVGMSLSWIVAGSLYFFIIWRIDWIKQAEDAEQRNIKALVSAGNAEQTAALMKPFDQVLDEEEE